MSAPGGGRPGERSINLDHRTDGLLFSTPRPVTRLLAAQWLAGAGPAAVSLLLTAGLAVLAVAGHRRLLSR